MQQPASPALQAKSQGAGVSIINILQMCESGFASNRAKCTRTATKCKGEARERQLEFTLQGMAVKDSRDSFVRAYVSRFEITLAN